jgi:uncharacterized repeat protein (TIGR01451 family)
MRVKTRSFAVLTLVLVASIAPTIHAATASAAVLGGFEIDGNLTDDANVTGLDWDTLPASEGTSFIDGSGAGDDSFTNSKELEPNKWKFVTGSVPSKNDLLSAGIAMRKSNGAHWLTVYSTRASESGNAFLDYEFNRSSETYDNDANPATPQVPVRTQGDVLLFIAILNGGSTTNVNVFNWSGDRFSGKWIAPAVTVTRGTDWEASTAGDSQGRFLTSEATISLEAFGLPPACPGLGKAWVKTTSAAQFTTAELKDRTAQKIVDVSTCASIAVHKVDDSQPAIALDGATFEARLDNGDGIYNAATDVAKGTCVTGAAGIVGDCTIPSLLPGTYFVREKSAPTGFGTSSVVAGPITLVAEQHHQIATAFIDHRLAPASAVAKGVRPAGSNDAFSGTTPSAPGAQVEYQLSYTNKGDGPATGVTIGETVPDNTTLVSCSDACDYTSTTAGSAVSWTIGTVAAGASVPVTMIVQIDDSFTQNSITITNVASADSATEEPVASDEVTVTLDADPDWLVTKTASKTVATVGDTVTYTIVVKNVGEGPGATSVPDEFDADHLQILTEGLVNDGDTLTFTTGTLNPDEEQSFSYDAKVIGPFDASEAGEPCEAGAPFPVLNTAGAGASSSTATICVSASPAFTSDKSVDATTAVVGQTLTYNVLVTNVGDGPGSTIATDTFDAEHLQIVTEGLTIVDGTIAFATDSLDPGESQEFTYQAVVQGTFESTDTDAACPDAGTFPVVNDVTVTGDSDSVTVCVDAPATFSVAKVADLQSANLGDEVTYTVTVHNAGPGPGATTATDTFDGEHLSITDAGGGTIDGNVITWSTSVIEPNGDLVFTYTGTFIGTFLAADATEACPDANTFPVLNQVSAADSTADATVCVAASPESALTKTVANDAAGTTGPQVAANPGDTITYTLTYTNTGPAEATDVVVTDHIPSGTTFASCTPSASCSLVDGDAVWQIASVLSGDSATMTLVVTLDESFPDGISVIDNVASAATHQESGPASSDRATVTVSVLHKSSCPSTLVPPGGAITYTITFGVFGRSVDGVTLVDHLPADLAYDAASPAPDSAPAVGDSGDITWNFGTLNPGDTKTVTIDATVSASLSQGATVTNTASLSGVGIDSVDADKTITVQVDGAHEESAHGLSGSVAGITIDPVPLSTPTETLGQHIADPINGEYVQADVLSVEEDGSTDNGGSSSSSSASLANVRLLDQTPGPLQSWLVTADVVKAVTGSNAGVDGASSTSQGSTLANVVVNGQTIGNVTEPVDITVPLPGGVTASVKLLETIKSGAALDPTSQPADGSNNSGTVVNAIHVTLTTPAGTLVELIVSHSDSSASFLSGARCGVQATPPASGSEPSDDGDAPAASSAPAKPVVPARPPVAPVTAAPTERSASITKVLGL